MRLCSQKGPSVCSAVPPPLRTRHRPFSIRCLPPRSARSHRRPERSPRGRADTDFVNPSLFPSCLRRQPLEGSSYRPILLARTVLIHWTEGQKEAVRFTVRFDTTGSAEEAGCLYSRAAERWSSRKLAAHRPLSRRILRPPTGPPRAKREPGPGIPGPRTDVPPMTTRRTLRAARRLASVLKPPSVLDHFPVGAKRLPGVDSSDSSRRKPFSTVRAAERSTSLGKSAWVSLSVLRGSPRPLPGAASRRIVGRRGRSSPG